MLGYKYVHTEYDTLQNKHTICRQNVYYRRTQISELLQPFMHKYEYRKAHYNKAALK